MVRDLDLVSLPDIAEGGGPKSTLGLTFMLAFLGLGSGLRVRVRVRVKLRVRVRVSEGLG